MNVISGWDEGEVIRAPADPNAVGLREVNLPPPRAIEEFKRFIRTFTYDGRFVYRDQLKQNLTLNRMYLEVDMEDLANWRLTEGEEGTLASKLRSSPAEFLPLFEKATTEYAAESKLSDELHDFDLNGAANENAPDQLERELARLNPNHQVQIVLRSGAESTTVPIRGLNSTHIGKIVMVPGIVISASRTHAKAAALTIECKYCRHRKVIAATAGVGAAVLPARCEGELQRRQTHAKAIGCGSNPYAIQAEEALFIDVQSMKLQESPETVPTGEMPRHIGLHCERYLCDKISPGTRVTAVGVYAVASGGGRRADGGVAAVALRQPYIRCCGLRIDTAGPGRSSATFRPDEEAQLLRLAHAPHLRTLIARSIAPAIYGHENIKKAIACLLFGGSRKRLPDGMTLRGDINLLLLGDPGTAKSQFLKFVEKVAPVAVYTSGKGSSAAGLTASVIREPSTKEFYLEGGAMVLADGGVVCIDEFDKMHTHDRVAIHEAMEQQTISIAKAGITTILNSRTSVLAAANPKFGRYDDARTPLENIEFQSTILSRFDMIFILKDVRNEDRDRAIAQHVVELHVGSRGGASSTSRRPYSEIDLNVLKRYIAFVRGRCSPRLSAEAAAVLVDHYVRIRSSMRQHEAAGEQQVVPIAVRQLEAVVRIAESLAKMTLSSVATEEHVNEAIQLFSVSTLDAASSGVAAAETLSPAAVQQLQAVETLLKRRLAIGSKANLAQLVREFESSHALSESTVRHAVHVLVLRDELEYQAQRKRIKRKR